MRQKLEEKKKLKRDPGRGRGGAGQSGSDARTVDELVKFIQGEEAEEAQAAGGGGVTAAGPVPGRKRGKKKQTKKASVRVIIWG